MGFNFFLQTAKRFVLKSKDFFCEWFLLETLSKMLRNLIFNHKFDQIMLNNT